MSGATLKMRPPGHDRENDAVMKVPVMKLAAVTILLSLLFCPAGRATGAAGAESRQAAESLAQKIASITHGIVAVQEGLRHRLPHRIGSSQSQHRRCRSTTGQLGCR